MLNTNALKHLIDQTFYVNSMSVYKTQFDLLTVLVDVLTATGLPKLIALYENMLDLLTVLWTFNCSS